MPLIKHLQEIADGLSDLERAMIRVLGWQAPIATPLQMSILTDAPIDRIKRGAVSLKQKCLIAYEQTAVLRPERLSRPLEQHVQNYDDVDTEPLTTRMPESVLLARWLNFARGEKHGDTIEPFCMTLRPWGATIADGCEFPSQESHSSLLQLNELLIAQRDYSCPWRERNGWRGGLQSDKPRLSHWVCRAKLTEMGLQAGGVIPDFAVITNNEVGYMLFYVVDFSKNLVKPFDTFSALVKQIGVHSRQERIKDQLGQRLKYVRKLIGETFNPYDFW